MYNGKLESTKKIIKDCAGFILKTRQNRESKKNKNTDFQREVKQ